MRRIYQCVGRKEIAARGVESQRGMLINSPGDVLAWVRQTDQELDKTGSVVATFIIDESGGLRIADRHSEHVICAGGKPVQSAGEMTFMIRGKQVRVAAVTNQSTGYCPEPESCTAVQAALERSGMEPPRNWDQAFVFRRCLHCGAVNIVKDGVFECAVCSRDLPAAWNLDLERLL
jgi:hypothetical protein